MTTIQQVLFEVEMDYAGHPYYVSGNAILHALAHDLDYGQQQHLRVSHGIFTPGQFGTYPTAHSQSGARPAMGSSLTPVESYRDLFLLRHASQPWLLDSRPRDALNTHDLKVQGDRPVLSRTTHIGKQTTWYIHCYLHATDDSLLPLDEATLDGVQFGGARNYGYGQTRLKDTQLVDCGQLSYDSLREADEHLIKLVTPYVTQSEMPHTDDVFGPPWWWDTNGDTVRRRTESLVEQRKQYEIHTIDHGQVFGYGGDRPVETARNGIERIGTHSKYGFGEFEVIPL